MKNWSYSIVEINADDYEKKLHPNNESIWETDIETYIPRIDSECFSLRTKEIFTRGNSLGISINPTTKFGVPRFGSWYSFDSAPSYLEHYAFYNNLDILTELKIYSKWNYYESLKIKEILRKLIENNGFILKKSNLIYGSDIIIKETEKGFLIGKINMKYDDEKKPSYGIYFTTYSKNHFF